MDIQTLTTFFMWCTIINGGLFTLWILVFFAAPDFVYRLHSKWFPCERETYNVIIYAFLGLFKIVFIVFNIVPYISLLIIGSNGSQ